MAELESYLGISLSALPDRTPSMHTEPIDYAAWTPVDRLLDLLEGMWAAQALKERHFDSWITDLRTMHIEQVGLMYRGILRASVCVLYYLHYVLSC